MKAAALLALALWPVAATAQPLPDQPTPAPVQTAQPLPAPAPPDCPATLPPVVAPRLAAPAPGAVVLAIGSSSTEGVGASAPDRTYPARLAALLPAVSVENAGRGGERAAATLARLQARLAAPPPPALVLWQVGVNDALDPAVADADFAAALDAGLAAIRAAGAQAALIDPQAFPGAPDPARYARFVALVAEAAARHGAALIPRHAMMTALDPATLKSLLAGDDFHMNDQGYACLARLVAAAISLAN